MASLLLGFIERSTFHVDAASPFYQLVFMKFIQLCSKVLFFFYFCHSLEMRLYTWKWGKNSDATKKITRSRTDCFNKLNRFAPKIFLFIKTKDEMTHGRVSFNINIPLYNTSNLFVFPPCYAMDDILCSQHHWFLSFLKW